jgi:hypothetical protein
MQEQSAIQNALDLVLGEFRTKGLVKSWSWDLGEDHEGESAKDDADHRACRGNALPDKLAGAALSKQSLRAPETPNRLRRRSHRRMSLQT